MALGGKLCRAPQAAVRDERPALRAQVHGAEEEVFCQFVRLLCDASCGAQYLSLIYDEQVR